MNKEYEKIKVAAASIQDKIPFKPDIAIVFGSGLTSNINGIEVVTKIPYNEIEGFPVSTVIGHVPELIFANISGKKCVIMGGRSHYYEHGNVNNSVFGIRLMKYLGAKYLILTNAAGGINKSFKVGDIMIITDHISSFIKSPLIGANIEEFGTRFPSMSNAYDKGLIDILKESAKKCGIDVREGVYVQTTGPQFETPIEIKMFRSLGADSVGMSTVMETIVGVHAGMKVCGLSTISNMAADCDNAPNHEEVIEAGKVTSKKVGALLIDAIGNMEV